MNVETRAWEPLFKAPPSRGVFLRAIAACVIGRATGRAPTDVTKERWPQDGPLLDVVTRAASAPAMTSVTGWAAELAHLVVADGLEALGGQSIGAQLLAQGLVLSWDGAGTISAPSFTASATAASFVAEGNPIPVRQFADTPALMVPAYLATIAVLTREMIESSNAEQLIGDALLRSMGMALDATLLDANPATAARPAGLRNGIAALTPSASTDGFEGVFEDMATLINGVAVVNSNATYAIIGSPGRIAGMQGRITSQLNVKFFGTNAVGNDLVAVAPAALVAALSPNPALETARAASLHMDTAPQPVGSVGPHRSLFQSDSIAIKARWPVSWALRSPAGVAWLTPAWK